MFVAGTVTVPGDKSLSHRALLFAAMASGTSRIERILTSLDVRSSARVLRQLGVEVSALAAGRVVTVQSRGGFRRPRGVLNCGNSGTTTRLLLGLLAAHSFTARLTGDRSLRRRPMRRVTEPLARMGAHIMEQNERGTLPLSIRGGPLTALRHEMPVSSAQIKGCLLLAGAAGAVPVSVREPHGRSRDHTERLLRTFGYSVVEEDAWVHFDSSGRVTPFHMQVPADPSSAAFPIGAAILAQGGEIRIPDVCVNPTRIGFLAVLERMGARVELDGLESRFGEPVATLLARPAALQATEVLPREIPALIDEVPLLAALATRAEGTTVFREVGELRVKESDRLGLIAENIRSLGGRAEVVENDLFVSGTEAPPVGRVRTEGDHRIAMAFAILGTSPGARVRVDDLACASVSFPDFPGMLRRIRR
ncbi:MAG TPA: 3-phosphoshikimate 1-carboxyvinyltransferase [Gemmatimonadales bacterium]|nr:3-phosphoshikimate 1-carboxyvinyltransferase [Gemmatimonadales bacterium]